MSFVIKATSPGVVTHYRGRGMAFWTYRRREAQLYPTRLAAVEELNSLRVRAPWELTIEPAKGEKKILTAQALADAYSGHTGSHLNPGHIAGLERVAELVREHGRG